jgi:hypothetical protein
MRCVLTPALLAKVKSSKQQCIMSDHRYVLPGAAADDDAHAEDSDADNVRRVQEAAGAALSEANERLLDAELRLQAAQARQLPLTSHDYYTIWLSDDMLAHSSILSMLPG